MKFSRLFLWAWVGCLLFLGVAFKLHAQPAEPGSQAGSTPAKKVDAEAGETIKGQATPNVHAYKMEKGITYRIIVKTNSFLPQVRIDGQGGGIHFSGRGRLELSDDMAVINNEASSGGGIYADGDVADDLVGRGVDDAESSRAFVRNVGERCRARAARQGCERSQENGREQRVLHVDGSRRSDECQGTIRSKVPSRSTSACRSAIATWPIVNASSR